MKLLSLSSMRFSGVPCQWKLRLMRRVFGAAAGRASAFAVVLASAILCLPALGQKPEELKFQGYVNDFAGVLNADAKARLTALCAEVDQKTKAQIAVVTVNSLNDQPVEDYTVDLAQRWGVGPKQASEGILILLAPKEHKYWTTVGYGLEGILPDGKVGGFGREAVPLLRNGDYGGALYLMTRRVADVIAADKGVTLTGASPRPTRSRRGQDNGLGPIGVIVLVVIVFAILSAVNRRGPGSGYTRRGGGWWIGPFIGGGMGGWGGGGWGGGGGFGGGGGGSGGFGGFGGGSFGGGGAGGSW